MLSLRELLARHPSLLLIDSASTNVQVGLFRADATPIWAEAVDEAGTAVFTGAQQVLERSGMTLDQVQAFAFCDGPGSVLGIRTAAVALRTWRVARNRPAFGYCSLRLVAAFQLQAGEPTPFSVIADARRETWHRVTAENATEVTPLHRVAAGGLSGVLLMPQHFRHWAPVPSTTRTVSYALPELLAATDRVPLFEQTDAPDAFLHEEPVYQTWTPQVHRAPS